MTDPQDDSADRPVSPFPTGREELPCAPEDRPLLSLLPLIYVAWADGELTPEEVAGIQRRLDETVPLDPHSRERLARWLDPASPPPARELAAMLRLIRQAGQSLEPDRRQSLAGLGRELARLGGAQEPVSRALEAMEAALGVVGSEAARQLLEPERPEPEPAVEAAPAFEPSALTRLLDGRYREVHEQVRALLSEPEFAYVYGLPSADYREQVLAWCRELARHGLGALSFPPSVGGAGDVGRFIAAFEGLAFHDLSLVVKFGVQFGLFGGSILNLGTERHHREYLPRVGSLELPGCFAMTEVGHGSNVRDLATVARLDRATDEFVIHTPGPLAKKQWIGNAAVHGRYATVFAQLEIDGESHGVHAFLVPIRDESGRPLPGVSLEDSGLKGGLNGVDNGLLSFEQVRVPRANLLDRFGSVDAEGRYSSPIPGASKRFFTMLGTLVGGRVSVAWASLSAAKTGLAIAVRYAARRRQFGPAGAAEIPILDYLAHQRRLMPPLATTYGFHFALARLRERFADRASGGEDDREIETLAAGLKAEASRFAVDLLQTCREACGGQGFRADNRIAPLRADLDIFTTFEGDNTVLLQLVAKGVLTDFRQQLGGFQIWSLVRYLAGRAATQLAELNPVITRRTDEDHLRDPEFQLAAFRYREQRLVWSAAGRLKARVDAGTDSFQAFNEMQDHLLTLGRAYVERVVLECFVEAIRGCEDEEPRVILKLLCDLHALSRLEADAAWFLRAGYLEAVKARAIRALVNRLCGEVRQQAVPLVEAFGIPDAVLAAPIAFGDGT